MDELERLTTKMLSLVEELSPILMAKVRAILLRKENQEEILTYMEAEIERKAERGRQEGEDWLKDVKIEIEEGRMSHPWGPEYPRFLPAVLIQISSRDGRTIVGSVRVRTDQ